MPAQARAKPLAPSQWRDMLRDALPASGGGGGGGAEECGAGSGAPAPAAVVLDVRNAYEWDAGHFQGAERPLEVRVPVHINCCRTTAVMRPL